MLNGIKSMVFDLDGTLYVNDHLAGEIMRCATRYISSLLGVDESGARRLIRETKARLSAASGTDSTLTAACMELGGDIRELHRFFADGIRPERFLRRDDGLVRFLHQFAARYDLHIYTNNNRRLTEVIVKSLGVAELFRQVFTIEDFWRPKPDGAALAEIFARIGREPAECLFVGDRYDIDLRLPADMGCSVFLAKGLRELLALVPVADG